MRFGTSKISLKKQCLNTELILINLYCIFSNFFLAAAGFLTTACYKITTLQQVVQKIS